MLSIMLPLPLLSGLLRLLPHPLLPGHAAMRGSPHGLQFSSSCTLLISSFIAIYFSVWLIIAFCIPFHIHHTDRHRRNILQCLHERIIKLYTSGKLRHLQFCDRFPSVWLTSNTVVTRNLGITISTISVSGCPSSPITGSFVTGRSFQSPVSPVSVLVR